MRLRLSILSHAVALVFGAYGVGLFLLGPSMTAIAATYHTVPAVVGMSYTAFSIGFLPGVFLAGYLYEQVSRKWTVAAGGGLISASLLFFAAAPAIGSSRMLWLAFAGMASLGFGGSLLELAGNAIMADLNPSRAALAVNYAHALLAVGAIAGPWVAGQFMQAGISWQIPYLIAGACCLIATIVLTLQREPPSESAKKMDIADMRALLRKGIVWAAFAGIGLYVAAETGIVGWVPTFMEESLGASKAASSSVISVFWLAMTVGRGFCTWGASLMRPQTWVMLLCALGAAASAGIGACHGQLACYLLVALSGLTFSGIFGMVLAHAAAELGRYLGAAYAVIVSGVAFGSLLFPPAMGWIAKASSMRVALIVPAILLAVQVLIYLPYIPKARRPAHSRPCHCERSEESLC
jgi:FHS family glucose/mannose:H+ symporter-like MFS transporter